MGKEEEAIKTFKEGLKIAKGINYPKLILIFYEQLSKANDRMGNYKEALEYQLLYSSIKDSLFTEETSNQITEMEVKYESEKKGQQIKFLEQEHLLDDLQHEEDKVIIFAISGGLLLIILFSFFIYHRLKITRKQKEVIEEQHGEIQASINYAKRIQTALLTADEYWQQISPDHFVYFKPRDIVSGDFFWAYHTDDGIAIWVAADCTGHGVPGAFMSMLGVGFLNDIVAEGGEIKADEILNQLRTKIIKALEQKGVATEQNDGMDIALCVWNKNTNTLQYAGAFNPLYIIRNGELIEYKADKQPIGKHSNDDSPFNAKELQLEKGDLLYTFSDGYVDQFGGPDGKKFMKKQFKQLLLSFQKEPLDKQKEILEQRLSAWMKESDTEQIDDICVVGVKI